MKSENTIHLDENQLVQAVVDASDLPESVQAHLATCSQCLAGKKTFEQELAILGQIAEQLAPKPQRRIVLPVKTLRRKFFSFWDWHRLMAAAATIAAVFIVVWGTNTARKFSERRNENMAAEMRDAKRLMTEVNTLIDNPLPSFYLEISAERNSDYDEKFYKFLIPTTEENTLTSGQEGKRGTSLC